MTDADYEDVENSPAVRYLNKIFLDAITSSTDLIRFKRLRDEEEMIISFIKNNEFSEYSRPPFALWQKFINRVKILARMVDYGPTPSKDGSFVLCFDDKNRWRFGLKSNPGFQDDMLEIIITSLPEKKSNNS